MPTDLDADTVLSLLEDDLRADLLASLKAGVRGNAILPWPRDPREIFRESLTESIRDIEGHPRGELLQRFLRIGPYHDAGPIPPAEVDRFLTDDEVAAAISFIYAHVIRSFQGRLAELLAIGPVLRLVRRLQAAGKLPSKALLYVGDVIAASYGRSTATAKAADFHVLSEGRTIRTARVVVHAAGEVKSYAASHRRVMGQLDRHLARAAGGLEVSGRNYPAESIGVVDRPIRVMVVPDRWRIPRSFRFEKRGQSRKLRVDAPKPPRSVDGLTDLGNGSWRIRLRWSHEALASAAFDMTFWYMAKVGAVVYRNGVPAEWAPMTPEEAGPNAAKMMLYYAILRARSDHEEQSAVALYNVYGFGYALGSSFRNAAGRREMLWPEDLREILAKGVTKQGCRLQGWQSQRQRVGRRNSCPPRSEPDCLRRGKEFHREVQRDWLKTAQGAIVPEKTITLSASGSTSLESGRMDILVDEFNNGDRKYVSIVEIKSTDWDLIKPRNIQKNLCSHRRQIWRYIEKFLDVDGDAVCPGIIYPNPPKTPGLRPRIESYLNDHGIQVVWYREP